MLVIASPLMAGVDNLLRCQLIDKRSAAIFTELADSFFTGLIDAQAGAAFERYSGLRAEPFWGAENAAGTLQNRLDRSFSTSDTVTNAPTGEPVAN